MTIYSLTLSEGMEQAELQMGETLERLIIDLHRPCGGVEGYIANSQC